MSSKILEALTPILNEYFDLVDQDNNGLISLDEIVSVKKKLGEKFDKEDKEQYDIMDKNKDGVISRDEYFSFMTAPFQDEPEEAFIESMKEAMAPIIEKLKEKK
eukprot:gene2160-2025_t